MVERARTIIIADPNPHVRKFLRREMTAAGYDVLLAYNLQELLRMVFEHNTIGLVIVDPDFPDMPVRALFRRLRKRIPPVPLITHTHDAATFDELEEKNDLLIVEKRGNSIEKLKQLAAQLLPPDGGRRSLDDRLDARPGSSGPQKESQPVADHRR